MSTPWPVSWRATQIFEGKSVWRCDADVVHPGVPSRGAVGSRCRTTSENGLDILAAPLSEAHAARRRRRGNPCPNAAFRMIRIPRRRNEMKFSPGRHDPGRAAIMGTLQILWLIYGVFLGSRNIIIMESDRNRCQLSRHSGSNVVSVRSGGAAKEGALASG